MKRLWVVLAFALICGCAGSGSTSSHNRNVQRYQIEPYARARR